MNVVFDFGAVLFTWQPRELLLQTFPERVCNAEQAQALAHQIFGHPDWHDFDRGLLGTDEVTERLTRRLGLPQMLTQQLLRTISEHLTPITEMVALLQGLHARRQQSQSVQGLYYLSNMPAAYAQYLQRKHAFLKCFDGGVFSSDVHLIKPDPAIYQVLQSRYHLTPTTTLFIDDLKGNVHAAQALGWQGIHFESPQQLRAQLAELALVGD